MKLSGQKLTGTRAGSNKIMERRFNIVDRIIHSAHTTENYSVQVHDYDQENCRDWRMHD
ncbi:hypothetical protein ENT52713_37160 [Enterobacter sp. 200527-13]|jgi:hypothetical protein|nr:hypothetical protein NMCA_39330 [Enterobacter ludwigii]GLH26320.1 hypothetical protein ENT52713_37160 [Enterobacter sp. 200527-13]